MKNLSFLASRAATEIQHHGETINISKTYIIQGPSSVYSQKNHGRNPRASSMGKPESKLSKSDSNSAPTAQISASENKFNTKHIDHQYFDKVLSRSDWYLLLNHEFRAQKINFNTQTAVSILQNQENPLRVMRFYIWLSNVCSSLARDQAIRNVLSNALYRKGPVMLSAELIQDIRNSGCKVNEDLLCVLIGSWGRLGLAKYCSEVFEQVSYLGLSPSTRLYNAVLDGLVKSNSLDLAYVKFQQMEVDKCIRDRFTYNILIHGVCKAGVMDEALRLVKQMDGLGYSPNVFTYTILIDGYCNAKRVDEALMLLKRMRGRNIRPNDATYRSLVNGIFRSLPPHEAFRKLLRWVNGESNLPRVVYDSILYCLCSNSLPKQAAAFFWTAEKQSYVPDSSVSNILVICLIKGLDLEEVCRIFDYLIKRGVKVELSACLSLVHALYSSMREEKGNQYFNWVVQEGRMGNVFAYNMVIDCFCKAEMMGRALETLEEMSRKGISPNLVTFNTLIAGYCKMKDVIKARELLLRLLDLGFRPDIFTFSSIIDVLCKANQIFDAFDCFLEMVEWGIHPNAIVYNSLIRSLCISGDVAKAMKLLKKMEVDGVRPEVYSFSALIQKYCKIKRIDVAQRLLLSMLSLDLKPDNYTYIAFINALCESGRFREAIELFLSMEKNGCKPDAYACNSLMDALVKSGKFKEAQDIWLKYKDKWTSLKPIPIKFDASGG